MGRECDELILITIEAQSSFSMLYGDGGSTLDHASEMIRAVSIILVACCGVKDPAHCAGHKAECTDSLAKPSRRNARTRCRVIQHCRIIRHSKELLR